VRDRDRIVELSTLDFLQLLEAEQCIQSAEQVFELAAKAGRLPSRVDKMTGHDEATRAAIIGACNATKDLTVRSHCRSRFRVTRPAPLPEEADNHAESRAL